jgi:hypothetical protein
MYPLWIWTNYSDYSDQHIYKHNWLSDQPKLWYYTNRKEGKSDTVILKKVLVCNRVHGADLPYDFTCTNVSDHSTDENNRVYTYQ